MRNLGRAIVTAAGLAAVGALWRSADDDQRRRKIAPRRKIVILGAGFAGMYAASELARLLPAGDGHQITIIDKNDYLLFTPMLTEAAGGMVSSTHIVKPVRRLSPRIRFEQGCITAIDLEARRVTLDDGRTLDADHLLLALGSVTDFHDIPGLKDHSISIKTLDDAVQIRDAARALLALAQTEPDAEKRRALLTVVVGGAGYTGVETLAAVNDWMRAELRHFPALSPAELQIILVDPVQRLLPELSEELGRYAEKKLTERGVTLRLNTQVTGAGDGWVEFDHDEKKKTDLVIWAGGVAAPPLVKNLPCEKGKSGGVIVDETCAVPNFSGVWAVGDNAEIPQKNSEKPYAPTAQNATREGVIVARNIVASLCGERLAPFVYTPVGELALVGKRVGVASVYGLRFSGLLAWAAWRVVYLSKMPGWTQRIQLLTDYLRDSLAGGAPVAGEDAAAQGKAGERGETAQYE